MTLDLSAIEARAQQATPGPWVMAASQADGDVRVCYMRDGEHCEWCLALMGERLNDGVEYCRKAAATVDMPDLFDLDESAA